MTCIKQAYHVYPVNIKNQVHQDDQVNLVYHVMCLTFGRVWVQFVWVQLSIYNLRTVLNLSAVSNMLMLMMNH